MSSDQKNNNEQVSDIKKAVEQKTKKSVVVPELLQEKSRFRFKCYPGIKCFTKCCSGIKIILSPYDIFRLKNSLGMTYLEFLSQYVVPTTIEMSPLPVVALKMKNDEIRSCPFVTSEGCSVYTERPMTCRYYPIGMGIMKKFDKKAGDSFFIKIKEDHCLGHLESKEWTIDEWRVDQGADLYDNINDDWMEVILKAKTLGMVEFSQRSLDLFYMVSTNLDLFRDFVFNSNFLKAYELDQNLVEKIRDDDFELLKFSLKWLRFTMFGEGDFKVNEEARRKAKERLIAEHEEKIRTQKEKEEEILKQQEI